MCLEDGDPCLMDYINEDLSVISNSRDLGFIPPPMPSNLTRITPFQKNKKHVIGSVRLNIRPKPIPELKFSLVWFGILIFHITNRTVLKPVGSVQFDSIWFLQSICQNSHQCVG